jgi:hypothetical protein
VRRHLLLSAVVLLGCNTEAPLDSQPGANAKPEPAAADDDVPVSGLLERPDAGAVPCFDPRADVDLAPPSGKREIELGAPDQATETLFVPFDRNCIVPIDGIGQAGLLARLAVRVKGNVEKALVEAHVYNALDLERRPGINNDADEERTLSCPGDGYCYAVPVHVEISHLNRLPELEGTLLWLQILVTEPDGAVSTREAWGVFQQW